jgi:hypothetical protein
MVVCEFPRLLVNESSGNSGGAVLNPHTTASSEIIDSIGGGPSQQFSMRVSDLALIQIIGIISELPMREMPIQTYEIG